MEVRANEISRLRWLLGHLLETEDDPKAENMRISAQKSLLVLTNSGG